MNREEPLSAAQVLVLRGLARGDKFNAIADAMPRNQRIGEHGVHYHVKEIYRKLGVNTRTAAVVAGMKSGLI